MSAQASETDEASPPFVTNAFYGNSGTEAALLAAYRSNRVPHAFLLIGQKGIGKATLAYRFARFVLAHPDPAAPEVQAAASLAVDAAHPVARRMAARAQGDLLILERTPNEKGVLRQQIAVDDIRRTITFFGSTAGEGGWRIAIVDAVDELNRFGANALLKVLEEPPQRTLLLLVCHSAARVLPTLRSRCSVMTMRPLEQTDVAAALAAAVGRSAERSGDCGGCRCCRRQCRARFDLPRRRRIGAAPASTRRTRSLADHQRRRATCARRRARRR